MRLDSSKMLPSLCRTHEVLWACPLSWQLTLSYLQDMLFSFPNCFSLISLDKGFRQW